MKKLDVAYFGSPEFSACFLEKLITDTSMNRYIEVKFVVTQPDQKVGRKRMLTSTPVKTIVRKYKIPVFDQNFQFSIFNFQSNLNDLNIKNLKNENLLKNEKFKMKIKDVDLVLLYAFGAIIPKELLDLPKYGFWCIHPSLLPKYRGTSPMATALINGDKITGVTIIKMDEKIDHGPIITQEEYEILPTDRRPDLEKKLTNLAFEMFKKIIQNVILGSSAFGETTPESLLDSGQARMTTIPQDHSKATCTKKLSKQDGFIPFENWKLKIENSPERIFNLFRGLYPWPGLWTVLPNGKRLKITDMALYDFKDFKTLRLLKVQLEGKKEVDFPIFNKAYKIF